MSVDDAKSPKAGFIGGLGVAANLVCDYSLYVIQTTGCEVPNAKGGLELLVAEQVSRYRSHIPFLFFSLCISIAQL